MSKVFKATSYAIVNGDKHRHLVYLNDETGVGSVAIVEGHTHQIIFQPPKEAITSPEGTLVQQATPGGWILYPSETDGHTHSIVALPKAKSPKPDDDEVLVKDAHLLYSTGREAEKESYDKGDESEEFVLGKQWNEDEKSKAEKNSQPYLTINKTIRGVDELVGYEIEQRTDIKYAPFEDGDQRAADLYSVVAKQIQEQCYYGREKTKVFRDVVVTGRGNFNLYADLTRDIRGEVKIERFPWKDIVYGPHEKEDLSDCDYVCKRRWYSFGKLKILFPEKAELLSREWGQVEDMASTGTQYADDEYSHPDKAFRTAILGEKLHDVATKQMKVIEVWQTYHVTDSVAASVEEDVYENIYDWTPDLSKQVEQLFIMPQGEPIPLFSKMEKPGKRLAITKVAGNTLLSYEYPAKLPTEDYFVAPCYAYKCGNLYQGKVEAVKDAQREINKRHSQLTDIINKTANYTKYYDASTFVDERELAKYKTQGSRPGSTFQLSDASRPPVSDEGIKFPSEIVNLIQLEDQQILDIMNVTVDVGGANTSAEALMQRKEVRLKGNEFLFDNLMYAQIRVGRLLLHLIKKYYTPDRIFRIVNNVHQKQPVELAGEDFSQFTEDEIVEILSRADIDKFDVVVVESAASPTVKLATYMMLQEMAKSGQPIPPDVIVELAPLPAEYKQKILASIAAQQEQAATGQSETSKTEIQKTLIAQGIIPPEVSETMGLNAPGTMPQGSPEEMMMGGGVQEGAPMEPPAPAPANDSSLAKIAEILAAAMANKGGDNSTHFHLSLPKGGDTGESDIAFNNGQVVPPEPMSTAPQVL